MAYQGIVMMVQFIHEKSAFTTAEFIKINDQRNGRDLYQVYDLAFDIGSLGSGITIEIPDGFITDGPSMPHWLLRFLPVEKMVKSSALHDYMRERLAFNKIVGDTIFLSAMKAEGTPYWLRWTAFIAVLLNPSRSRATNQSFTLRESK